MIADHLLYTPENIQYKNIMEDAQRTFQTQKKGASLSDVPGGSVEGSENMNTSSAGTANSCTDPKMEVDVDVAVSPPSSSSPVMPSSVYGAEHLLRLFVRMPLFLSRAQIPTTHIPILHQYWKELLGLVLAASGRPPPPTHTHHAPTHTHTHPHPHPHTYTHTQSRT